MLELVKNEHVVNQIATGLSNCGNGDHGSNGSELDTQTNMIVADKQAYLFSYSGLNAKVRTFSDEAKRIQDMHIGAAMWAYGYPCSGITYIFVACDYYVPSIYTNLFPAFLL